MKKLVFVVLTAVFTTVQLFSQNFSIQDYPLKDFKATEIKYRLLDMNTRLYLYGLQKESNEDQNSFNGDLNFHLYSYRNRSNFQGINDMYLSSSFQSTRSKNDSIKESQSMINLNYDQYSQNRFYNQNNAFIGLHGIVNLRISPFFVKIVDSKYDIFFQSLDFEPFISGGKGRIEPVASAQQAMDILIALKKTTG